MGSLTLTIFLTFILMVLVAGGLSIGLILTGRSRLHKGCGFVPKENREKEEGSCSLCDNHHICERKTTENNNDNG